MFVPNFSGQPLQPWWCSLGLILIFDLTRLDFDCDSIKESIESIGKIDGILHGVVSQDVDVQVTASHGAVLLVVDADVHLQFEIFKSETLKDKDKREEVYLHFWHKSDHSCRGSRVLWQSCSRGRRRYLGLSSGWMCLERIGKNKVSLTILKWLIDAKSVIILDSRN